MGIIDFFFLFLLLTRIRVITEKFSSREIFKQLYYVKFQERIFDFPLFAQLMKNSRSVKFEKFEKFDRHIPFITLTFDYPRNRGFVRQQLCSAYYRGKYTIPVGDEPF